MKALRLVRHAAEGLLALCLLGMVVAVFGNVVLRYVWGTGWVVSEELSRLLFVWLVAVAATLTFAEGKHLGFDLVTAHLRGLLAAAMRWLTRALIALALYHLISGAWAQVLVGMDSRSPVMNYPLALGAGAIFVMGMCMALLLVLQAVAELTGKDGHAAHDAGDAP